jgi:hypothetical protein
MKSTRIAVLNLCLVAVMAADGLRGNLDRNLKKKDVFDTALQTVSTTDSIVESMVSDVDEVVQDVGDAVVTQLLIQLKTIANAKLYGPEVTCTNTYDKSNRDLPLWDFIKVSIDLEGTNWLLEHNILDEWVLPDQPNEEGLIRVFDRRLLVGEVSEEEDRMLWSTAGYYYKTASTCMYCSADDGDGSYRNRKLGDSEGTGTTFTDAIAKNLKQLLRQKCTKMGVLSQVIFSPVVDESE